MYENLFELEQYRNMTADELMKKYNLVVYEFRDIEKLNKALNIINDILNKYEKKHK